MDFGSDFFKTLGEAAGKAEGSLDGEYANKSKELRAANWEKVSSELRAKNLTCGIVDGQTVEIVGEFKDYLIGYLGSYMEMYVIKNPPEKTSKPTVEVLRLQKASNRQLNRIAVALFTDRTMLFVDTNGQPVVITEEKFTRVNCGSQASYKFTRESQNSSDISSTAGVQSGAISERSPTAAEMSINQLSSSSTAGSQSAISERSPVSFNQISQLSSDRDIQLISDRDRKKVSYILDLIEKLHIERKGKIEDVLEDIVDLIASTSQQPEVIYPRSFFFFF